MSAGLMRLREVLRLVPVHRNTLAKWIDAGLFPAPVRLGARRAWDRAEVTAWIDARKGERPATINKE